MQGIYYILKNKKAVPCSDVATWGKWLATADRKVDRTIIGDSDISTVFLGFDHSFVKQELPILFETLVFGGKLDGEMNRYATWDEAVSGHKAMIKKVKNAYNKAIMKE